MRPFEVGCVDRLMSARKTAAANTIRAIVKLHNMYCIFVGLTLTLMKNKTCFVNKMGIYYRQW